MSNDRIRVSDADRERVTARLRDHYAEGRLSAEEMEERITAALNAKTVGDLRQVMADLPEPELAGAGGPGGRPGPGAPMAAAWAGPGWAGPGWGPAGWRGRGPMVRRGPRLLPLALVLLIATVAIPGAGFVLFAFFKIVLLLWLVACLAGMFAAGRFARRVRRQWRDGDGPYWQQHHHRWDV
jgi:hypothetical protein